MTGEHCAYITLLGARAILNRHKVSTLLTLWIFFHTLLIKANVVTKKRYFFKSFPMSSKSSWNKERSMFT